jgi:hypothetical protein
MCIHACVIDVEDLGAFMLKLIKCQGVMKRERVKVAKVM